MQQQFIITIDDQVSRDFALNFFKNANFIKFLFTDLSSAKKRPALVVFNDTVDQTGDYLMVQITSREKTLV